MSRTVTFVDTSVLVEILAVPGVSQMANEIEQEFTARVGAGAEEFVIPITALVETGNHICHANGDRRNAAERFEVLLRQLVNDTAPWKANHLQWDVNSLERFRQGGCAASTLVDLLGNQHAGGGDIALLVEAELFESNTYGLTVGIWTLDGTLESLWSTH